MGWALLTGAMACGGSAGDGSDSASDATSDADSTTNSDADGTGSESGDGDTGPRLDVAPKDLPDGDPGCTMPAPADVDPDGAAPCFDEAPPDSFDPVVQWSWEKGESYHVPLVVNLTDDNDNGIVDVCDTPDVIVHTGTAGGTLWVLDGETGDELFSIGGMLDPNTTPAVGDIDSDGLPEIVAAGGTPFAASLRAFEHDGTPKWTSDQIYMAMAGSAIGIANLDAQGPAEVYVANVVVRGIDGKGLFAAPTGGGIGNQVTAPVAADLDGDGDMEFIRSNSAYHHDGTVYFSDDAIYPGFPQVANLDDDDDPEVLIISTQGISVLEHTGVPKFQNLRPSGDPAGFSWIRPATVHDFDGNGDPEFAVSSASHYAAYHHDAMVMWIADVQDPSGVAAGTAFDFLGDGTAEAMFADEYHLFAFDTTGSPLMEVDRSSGTLIEYPSVADVDNDGSAEILVVSNKNFDMEQLTPTLQVIGDADDRWIQARRIWNQHTYHVTNVNEDGTIPQVEPQSWKLLNTYRTNAQIEDGSVCVPPEG